MNSKKGSVLILTLWTLSFLTVFSIGLANNISAQLRVASHLQDRLKMYYLAAAGIERGIVEITGNDETPSYDTLNETWSNNEESFNELPLGDGYITLSYQLNKEVPESQSVQESGEITLYGLMDESSKININEVPAGVLKTLLGNIGEVEKEEASDIANSIIDWRDLDVVVSSGGAEDFYYQSLESPYPCKNGKFQVLEELLLVKGMTPELFLKIKDVITIYGDSRVNINTADRLTLRALGLSSELAKRIVEFRQGSGGEGEAEEDKNFFKTVAELNNIGALFTEESQELSRVISLNILTV
ncbi:MAG: general secretion pathway protein GspK, partial [Candidatus Omnitrophota bacterium]|nr:general secretion pathway protein GspK [Candidatus Omnitrophota bacterium]